MRPSGLVLFPIDAPTNSRIRVRESPKGDIIQVSSRQYKMGLSRVPFCNRGYGVGVVGVGVSVMPPVGVSLGIKVPSVGAGLPPPPH